MILSEKIHSIKIRIEWDTNICSKPSELRTLSYPTHIKLVKKEPLREFNKISANAAFRFPVSPDFTSNVTKECNI